jgi:hypothetical protein
VRGIQTEGHSSKPHNIFGIRTTMTKPLPLRAIRATAPDDGEIGDESCQQERQPSTTESPMPELEPRHIVAFSQQVGGRCDRSTSLKSRASRLNNRKGLYSGKEEERRATETDSSQHDVPHYQVSHPTTNFGGRRYNVSFSHQVGRSGSKTSNLKSENSLMGAATDQHPTVMGSLQHVQSHTRESQQQNQSSGCTLVHLAGDSGATHLNSSHSARLSHGEGQRTAKESSASTGATRPGAYSIYPQGDDQAVRVSIPGHRSSNSSSRNENEILIQGHLVQERTSPAGTALIRSSPPLGTAATLNSSPVPIQLVDARRISDDDGTNEGDRWKRRGPRYYLIRFGATVILLGTIGLLVGLPVREKYKTPASAPGLSASPTANETRPGNFSIETFIQFEIPEYSRQGILADKRSPQSLAIEFLSGDPQLSSYPSGRRLTRFALATLYYALNNFVLPEQKHWDNFTGWATNATECDWYTTRNRSACAPGGQFVSLAVEENLLTGKLQREIALLTDLKEIRLARNNILGTIPSTMDFIDLLSVLDLSDNILSGTIPAVLGSSRQLVYLNLQRNFLRGSIPFSLFNNSVVNLQHGPVRRRYLTQNAGNSSPLFEVVNFGLNALTGSIPSSIGMAHDLRVLDLRYNEIHGAIPSSLSKLSLSYFGRCGFGSRCLAYSEMQLMLHIFVWA